MAGLAGVLANIPGLAGWEAGNQMGQQTQANQLRQVTGVMGLQQALQAQAEKQRASQMEQQFRAEIANAKTPEEQLKVAAKYMGPDALGRMVQGSQDKQAQIAATREATMARLQQAANQFEANYQMRLRSATTQEERLNLDRQREAFRQSLQSEAARLAGAQANYNFGFLPSAPPAPTVTPPQAAPNGQTVQGQFGDVSVNLQNASPALMAAARAQPEAQGSPELMTALGGAPAAPTPVPAPQPASAPAPAAPNNLDARDLGAGARGPVIPPSPQPAAPSAPEAPSSGLPPMPEEVKRMPMKDQNKWKLDQLKASNAGGGILNPQTLKFVAKQYLTGDRQAVQGFARNATARIALQNAIVDEAMAQGLGPEATAAKMAEYAGITAGSRTIGQRSANISLAATEAQEMIQIVRDASAKVGRTQFVPWNVALRAYETNTGSPEISAFGASVNALVNVYARAINPTGQPTVSDKEHARDVINTVQSPAQVDAVLNIINRELEIAKKAPKSVREALRKEVDNKGATSTGKPSADSFFK